MQHSVERWIQTESMPEIKLQSAVVALNVEDLLALLIRKKKQTPFLCYIFLSLDYRSMDLNKLLSKESYDHTIVAVIGD